MIGQFVQKLHQGVAPQRSMANGGGSGGGSSGTPYYANQDKLFGAQADIAQNLYNQYASLAPGYLQNSLDMTNEAMDGTLADKMRQQAGNDAAAANGNSWDAANRNMSRMGANFSTDRMLSELNKNSIMGAANMTGALNNATSAAEDQKWNRNAGAYGQIAGMGNGAMQGMGSAASGYGQMSGQIASNNAANAAGYGKFGAAMAAGSKWADGGYIEKPGLKLAQGAYVRGSQSVYKPAGYQQQVLSMPSADWRNQQTSGSYGGSKPVNPALAILGGAAPYMLGAGLKEYGAPAAKDLWKSGKEALMRKYDDYRAQQAEYDAAAQADASAGYTGAEAFGTQGGGADTLDWGRQDEVDQAWLDGNSGMYDQEFYVANGGYIKKRGLHLASGGYAEPISGSYESDPYRFAPSEEDLYMRRLGNSAAATASNPMAYASAYGRYNKAMADASKANAGAAPDASNTATISVEPVDGGSSDLLKVQDTAVPETAAVPETYAVPDTTGAETVSVVDGAGTGAEAAGSATDATATLSVADGAAEGAAGAGTSAVPYASIVKGVADIAAGRDAGTAVADAALGYGGAEAGAALGTAVLPGVGTVVGGVLGGLLGGSIFKDGGKVSKPGLRQGRKNLKPGGKVQGPGTETSDDIPAWLSDGEYVLNAEAVKLIGREKLDALNHRGLQMRGQKEEVAEGHPGVKDSPAEEKREARGLKAKPVKKAKGGMIKRKGC